MGMGHWGYTRVIKAESPEEELHGNGAVGICRNDKKVEALRGTGMEMGAFGICRGSGGA